MDPAVVQARLYIRLTTSWRGPLWMRDLGFHVADLQDDFDLCRPQRQPLCGPGYGRFHNHRSSHLDLECVAVGQEYTP